LVVSSTIAIHDWDITLICCGHLSTFEFRPIKRQIQKRLEVINTTKVVERGGATALRSSPGVQAA